MRRAAIAILTGFFVMATVPASAQAPAPTDPKLAAAMDVVKAANVKANILNVVDAMIPVVIAQIRRQRPNANDAAISAFQTAFKDEMLANIDDYLVAAAQVYASHFSIEELGAISAFWRSDVGEKFSAAMPDITKEMLPIATAWGAATAAKAIKTATERVKQNGLNL